MDNQTFFERTGAVLIVVCAIALIAAFGYSCYMTKNKSVKTVTVKVVVPMDSTGVMGVETVKSLEALKSELTRHEHLLEDRYKHILEQKEDMNNLLSIGGMFLAVILGIFGFFGYKSINSIEEKVKNEAERVAEETSKKKIEGIESQIEENVTFAVNKCIKKSLATQSAAMNKKAEATIKEKLRDNLQLVKDIEEKMEATSTSIENLDQKVVRLKEKVEKIEAQTSQPQSGRGRRTLAKGGHES